MTDFVKLILKQKIGGLTNNENFGSSSFFKGGQVGICFASWKKSDWFLPPQHIKKWEKVWFFSKPEKNVLHDHSGKGVKHYMKKLRFQKKNSMNPKLACHWKLSFSAMEWFLKKTKCVLECWANFWYDWQSCFLKMKV